MEPAEIISIMKSESENFDNLTLDELTMLKQKYGLMEPVLEPVEKYLILREEGKA